MSRNRNRIQSQKRSLRAQEIVSSSNLLTRACLAGYTADSLLVFRPRPPRIRGWIGFIAWTLFVICVMSAPMSTSAFAELATLPN